MNSLFRLNGLRLPDGRGYFSSILISRSARVVRRFSRRRYAKAANEIDRISSAGIRASASRRHAPRPPPPCNTNGYWPRYRASLYASLDPPGAHGKIIDGAMAARYDDQRRRYARSATPAAYTTALDAEVAGAAAVEQE